MIALLGLVLGCGADEITVTDEVVLAACGTCVLKMPHRKGCFWAVEIEQTYYPASGTLPEGHDSHGPEGMCVMPRQATVSGTVSGGRFVATRFDLLDVDPNAPKPKLTPHKH